MVKGGGQSLASYAEKEIIKVFVWVQETMYYDRIMFLFRENFANILKAGETIKDGLRTRMIACVASFTRSSGQLKRKEKTCLLFLMRGRSLQVDHCNIKVVIDLYLVLD